ncbi:MAG: hypothetical protein F9K44_00635 [Hyphomicrobiaceae bacterium]|nr:MAG: hypothetical protein F9K44_00635 [Hyphomicrobiaceae bacterium]
MPEADWTLIGLWSALIASGLYHGLNPGMGWPLAVSAALMERNPAALFSALGYLAAGHLAAMLAVMLPFAFMAALVYWRWHIQLAAALIVIGFGCALLIWRRHPRALVRIPPTQLALWSFAIATAHGAGLMLLPIYLGLCRPSEWDAGHLAASALMGSNLAMAVVVSVSHTLAMLLAGGAMAWLIYRYLGLKVLSRTWFNLDVLWAGSLILIGVLALAFNAGGT